MPTRYAANSAVEEILYLADHVESIEFKALSAGLGIRTKTGIPIRRVESTPSLQISTNKKVELPPTFIRDFSAPQAQVITPLSSPTPVMAKLPPAAPVRSMRIFLHRLLIPHLADLIVVSTALLVVFSISCVFFAPRAGLTDWRQLVQWEPIKFLFELHAWQVAALLYTVFGVYWLVFRFVVGHTLGQNVLINLRSSQKITSADTKQNQG